MLTKHAAKFPESHALCLTTGPRKGHGRTCRVCATTSPRDAFSLSMERRWYWLGAVKVSSTDRHTKGRGEPNQAFWRATRSLYRSVVCCNSFFPSTTLHIVFHHNLSLSNTFFFAVLRMDTKGTVGVAGWCYLAWVGLFYIHSTLVLVGSHIYCFAWRSVPVALKK